MSELIAQKIPNLINGVSQQEPTLRLPTQCSEQINCRNSVVDGMGKRPNTVMVAEIPALDNVDLSDSYFTTISRDDREQYKLVISDENLRVFDALTGTEYPVVLGEGTPDFKYLDFYDGDRANSQFETITTADTTFILNKRVPVRYIRGTE